MFFTTDLISGLDTYQSSSNYSFAVSNEYILHDIYVNSLSEIQVLASSSVEQK